MSANTKIYYQEVDMRKVLDLYANSFNPPDDGKVLQWDANYDSHTGKVWFKLIIEMPAPKEKNVILMDRCAGNGH